MFQQRTVVKDSVNVSAVIRIVDSTTFLPEEAVEHTTTGLALWYRREGGLKSSITPLVALAALTDAHSDGGIEHIDDGYYRFDVPDAAFATGVDGVVIGGTATGMLIHGCYFPLVETNPTVDIASINGDATVADNLEASGETIETGTVDTVTNGHTPTTTVFQADDIVVAHADYLIGRALAFRTGANAKESRVISAYTTVGGIAQFTMQVAFPFAPANNDTFVVW